ncbi:MAG: hypothetical protein K2X82_08435 [Gemmataceae bacterium]|nr:hypothetical protein [Gemmataceae bacterium]
MPMPLYPSGKLTAGGQARPRPPERVYCEGGAVAYYHLSPDTEPDVIRAGHRREVRAAWAAGLRSASEIADKLYMPAWVVFHHLIALGLAPADLADATAKAPREKKKAGETLKAVVVFLRQNGPATQKQIREAVGVSQPAVSRILNMPGYFRRVHTGARRTNFTALWGLATACPKEVA